MNVGTVVSLASASAVPFMPAATFWSFVHDRMLNGRRSAFGHLRAFAKGRFQVAQTRSLPESGSCGTDHLSQSCTEICILGP
jgi:hypothetical protein